MRRLFFVLAWNDCIQATWMLAGGRLGQTAFALASAFRYLDQTARSWDDTFRWSPILAPRHGLTATPRDVDNRR